MYKKKLLIMSVTVALVLILAACSSNEKTEEELKAEIRAELEAEEKLKEELKAELEAEMAAEAAENEQESSSNEGANDTSSNKVEATDDYVDKDLEDVGTNKLKIMTAALNVRSDMTTDSEVIGKVYLDENYEILEVPEYGGEYEWVKIKIDDSTEGWIAGAFTKNLENAVPVSGAPEFPIPSEGQIEISLEMTKREIISAIGEAYKLETSQTEGYYVYETSLEYDDIFFYFYHDKPLSDNTKFSNVTIKSNKYTVKDVDIKLGDPLVDAVKFSEENYSLVENHHGFELTVSPEIWLYVDGELRRPIRFNESVYDMTGIVEDNSNLLYVKKISLFSILD